MSDSFSSRSAVVIHAIAITAAVAFLSGHSQLKRTVPSAQAPTSSIQLSAQR
ncbi:MULTISPECIES: hypothetical protein [Trichocoleus]|uniref:Uncharacterized protein n=1 Tax=Trichocoleus desertorum GB2-A4 TaxID=2933944 RepID=A0ABV0JBW1_9CYAN|nr:MULTISPECIES: hypothetical protein [unclassified Trichocoleus]MBD1862909.1 hypothetical protein [Trichocoleus sp. FACHB-46]MBD2094927.1 hypothetical protein [Trichocoleus sp. FACHB-591]MBD2124412.1 hypothetical protein [Trichocoleus sp. FACHB-262]